MRIAIMSNFGPPHTGGSEEVIKHISRRMVQDYNHEVTILSYNFGRKSYPGVNSYPENDGIKKVLLKRGCNILSSVKEFDHIFVYSDSFWSWEELLYNVDNIRAKITIALVGMYHSLNPANKKALNFFVKNNDKINIITHSEITQDFIECKKLGITPTVIENGVDLEEFNGIKTFPLDKIRYDIQTKYLLLCVTNPFYGKGIEYLGDIGRELNNYIGDTFTLCWVHNTINYPYAKVFEQRAIQKLNKNRIRYIDCKDLPRSEVVSLYNHADVFLFPSLKEVAPLVLLEANAANLPWVSMDVGNVERLVGGMMIPNSNVDSKNYKVMGINTIQTYASAIAEILNGNADFGNEGREAIEKRHDWDVLCEDYNKIFSE
jgi:glycosyltransferase involved in cell wall biosynthesis